MIWADGAIVPRERFRLDPFDEGVLYGMGLFETTRTFERRPWLWDRHVARLRQGAERLGIAVAESDLPDADETASFVNAIGSEDVVVRLNVGAGSADAHSRVWMFARPLSPAPQSVRLKISPYRISTFDPLASLKCFNYGSRLSAHRRSVAEGWDDALLLSCEHHVLEATRANVFFRFDSGWSTPATAGGVLPGTVRALLLETPPFPIRERTIEAGELPEVREAFITNSVQGLVPVAAVDELSLPGQAMSEQCRAFADLLQRRRAN